MTRCVVLLGILLAQSVLAGPIRSHWNEATESFQADQVSWLAARATRSYVMTAGGNYNAVSVELDIKGCNRVAGSSYTLGKSSSALVGLMNIQNETHAKKL